MPTCSCSCSKRENGYNWGPLNETTSFSILFSWQTIFWLVWTRDTLAAEIPPFSQREFVLTWKPELTCFLLVQRVGKFWPPAWKQTRSPRGATRWRCRPEHKLIARPSLMMQAATDRSFQFYLMGQVHVIREMLYPPPPPNAWLNFL